MKIFFLIFLILTSVFSIPFAYSNSESAEEYLKTSKNDSEFIDKNVVKSALGRSEMLKTLDRIYGCDRLLSLTSGMVVIHNSNKSIIDNFDEKDIEMFIACINEMKDITEEEKAFAEILFMTKIVRGTLQEIENENKKTFETTMTFTIIISAVSISLGGISIAVALMERRKH